MTQDETENNSQPVAFMAGVKLGSLAGQLIQVEHATNLNPKLYDGPFPVFRHPVHGEVDSLHAQLAERDALLREISNWLVCEAIAPPEDMAQSFTPFREAIDKVLSASAE